MHEIDAPNTPATTSRIDSLKSWTMVIITLVFVTLYVLSLTGVGKLPEAIKELQPIIFVIIGYYFGRLPSQSVENSLKEQVRSQANYATAARNAQGKAEIDREVLEEKMKNTKTILETARAGNGAEAMTTPVEAAINVLSS